MRAWWQKHWENATLALCTALFVGTIALMLTIDFMDGMW